jgi:hypothetical protein
MVATSLPVRYPQYISEVYYREGVVARSRSRRCDRTTGKQAFPIFEHLQSWLFTPELQWQPGVNGVSYRGTGNVWGSPEAVADGDDTRTPPCKIRHIHILCGSYTGWGVFRLYIPTSPLPVRYAIHVTYVSYREGRRCRPVWGWSVGW